MPSPSTATHLRLNNITKQIVVSAETLEILASSLKTPLLTEISNTTNALLNVAQTIRQNKNRCAQLMEQTYMLLSSIVAVHIKTGIAGELSPRVLNLVGKFTETLHKIHTFLDAHQDSNRIRKFFRQGELSRLLKDCEAGLQEGLNFFHLECGNVIPDIAEMAQTAHSRHREVLDMIEELSEASSSDGASSIVNVYGGPDNSSTSITMLPPEPKIFHGRELELADILKLFIQTPRLAILGAGGMGKTSLARSVLHHPEIVGRYGQQRFFVACDSAATTPELAGLIGAHVGLKTGKDITHLVAHHFSYSPSSLLILDNLETLWEPADSRAELEEFLSLLTDVRHLALMVTMRGAERPGKVQWTRPFLQPLKPLSQDAARETFNDITGDIHVIDEVDKVLQLTDNMPLAINLIGHLVESEGCAEVLSRWELEKTSLISEGYDKRYNLDVSISLSLSSPRMTARPHSRDLLSLLSILPDGLSDSQLLQSKLPLQDILGCKATLIRTALAYSDSQKRLRALVPIREYMHRAQPPQENIIQPVLNHFHDLLECYIVGSGSASSQAASQIVSNYSNIQTVLGKGLQLGHQDLVKSIYSVCNLNRFSCRTSRGMNPLMNSIPNILPQPFDVRLRVYIITELFSSSLQCPLMDAEKLKDQGLQHINEFDDPDLKCKFYNSIADCHSQQNLDIPTAIEFCQSALSLSISIGNSHAQSHALHRLARIQWQLGDNAKAQTYAHESVRVARIFGHPFHEAQALRLEAMCWMELGHTKQSLALCNRARELLPLCGISGGYLDHAIMTTQATVHHIKTEFVEAHLIHDQILEVVSEQQDFYSHGFALINIAGLDDVLGVPKEDVKKNIDKAASMFASVGFTQGAAICEITMASLHLRDGNRETAALVFEKYLKLSWGNSTQMTIHCLESLADVRCWGFKDPSSKWPTVLLAHSLKSKRRLGIYRAFHFLADISLNHCDENVACALFTVALEAYTQMDVHQSRAECMLQLGNIANGHGDLLKAVELWETAVVLFKRSSQMRQAAEINERLAKVINTHELHGGTQISSLSRGGINEPE